MASEWILLQIAGHVYVHDIMVQVSSWVMIELTAQLGTMHACP